MEITEPNASSTPAKSLSCADKKKTEKKVALLRHELKFEIIKNYRIPSN
jgi:hypothetical protein